MNGRNSRRRTDHTDDSAKGILEVTGLRSKQDQQETEVLMKRMGDMTLAEMDSQGLIPAGIPGILPGDDVGWAAT